MKINIDEIDVKERKADKRGRVSIGKEYADRNVKVLVLEVEEDE